MIDARALANFVLDLAEREGAQVSNLALNKIVYFVHGAYLASKGTSLIDAKIEAWQYGPVFREIYNEFKTFKEKPITSRAKIFDPMVEEYVVCSYKFEQREYEFLMKAALPLIKMRPSALVNLSHVQDGPWHKAWFYDGEANPGMEITNESIKEYFLKQVRH